MFAGQDPDAALAVFVLLGGVEVEIEDAAVGRLDAEVDFADAAAAQTG